MGDGAMLSIREMPESDRPVSRLIREGPDVCSNVELLAAVVGNDHGLQQAYSLVEMFGNDLNRATVDQLMEIDGVGRATAVRIRAALTLGIRMAQVQTDGKFVIQNPEQAASLFEAEMSALEKEELWVLLLNARNQMLRRVKVYKGSVNTSLIRIAEVLEPAVRAGAAAVIVMHNHPSGDPSPSPEDVAVTRAMVEAGRLLDIEVLDHLIIGGGRYVSLKSKGLGFGQ